MKALQLAAWIVGLLVATFVLMAAFGPKDPQQDARRIARGAIELCNTEANDPLAELSTRRNIRDVCRNMERDFEQKFGARP